MYIIPTFYTIKRSNNGDVVIGIKNKKCILETKLLTSLNLMDKLTYMTL
jgi:hypothetical protein